MCSPDSSGNPLKAAMSFEPSAVYLNYVLAWIGLGMILGLLALAVMPSADGRGSLATVLMATAGTMIGCLMLQSLTHQSQWILPVSMQGFMVGLGGAAVTLIFFRVLGGHWLMELDYGIFRHHRRRRRRYLASEDEPFTSRRRGSELD
jgi:uncharacterized membrane protein YeaQ/YmgE (transglycosylase-associated protein family)